jgi:hypothetical protein
MLFVPGWLSYESCILQAETYVLWNVFSLVVSGFRTAPFTEEILITPVPLSRGLDRFTFLVQEGYGIVVSLHFCPFYDTTLVCMLHLHHCP